MTPASHAMPAPLFYGTPVTRRKAGRPRGSKAQVVQDARALGVHHFAFVRSSILDPDLAEYKAAFGLDNVDAIEAGSEFKDPVAERVR